MKLRLVVGVDGRLRVWDITRMTLSQRLSVSFGQNYAPAPYFDLHLHNSALDIERKRVEALDDALNYPARNFNADDFYNEILEFYDGEDHTWD